MREKKPGSYKEIVKIPKNLKDKLPTSYDVVGNIILLKIPEELLEYKNEIGSSLLTTHKNIKTVCLIEPVSGEYRTRKIEVIAGDKNTETIHKEYGLKFHVDVGKTYFSPRLANERMRIAKLVKKDEIIVDMFTGVAPFSIMIAKNSASKIIYAIDKNKDSIIYAKTNVKINNLLNRIEVINNNSKLIKDILPENLSVDRIIMNLPMGSFNFFKYALDIIDDKSIIHYYEILSENNFAERIESLKKIAKDKNIVLKRVDINKIKSYAPHEFYICFDITAKKNWCRCSSVGGAADL